jgi:hypothetical protein
MPPMEQARGYAFWSVVIALTLLCPIYGCDRRAPAADRGAARVALIGGQAAPSLHSTVFLSHADDAVACSGVLVARRLVVTAAHCTMTTSGAEPLRVDGFVVGFGPDRDSGEARLVERIQLTQGSGTRELAALVAAGEDVAALWLATDAPVEAVPLRVGLEYQPFARDAFLLSGFGLSSADGTNGARLSSAGTLAGIEEATGVLQIEGTGACYGDSGGPAMLQRRDALVGVIGQVATLDDAGACDADKAFAYSVLNDRVRELLEQTCEEAGGCGPALEPSPDDAGDDDTEPDSGEPREAGSDASDTEDDASVGPVHEAPEERAGGCACHSGPSRSARVTDVLFVLGALSLLTLRSRRPRRVQRPL